MPPELILHFIVTMLFHAGLLYLSHPVHLGDRVYSVIWKNVCYTKTQDTKAAVNLFERRRVEITGSVQKHLYYC